MEAPAANWILMTLIQDETPQHASVIPDKCRAPQLSRAVNPGAFFDAFGDSQTCLSPAILVAVLVWSPVSGPLEFQPREVTVE